MKKILLATLILLITSQNCFAQNADSEQGAKIETTLLPQATVIGINQATSEEAENTTTDETQANAELQGYLEYDDAPDETIYLEEQVESSQNTVYLKSPTAKGLELKAPTKVGSKSLISASIKKIPMTNLNNFNAASKFSTQEYSFNPVSSSYSVKSGGLSFGTTYNSGLDSSAQSTYSTGVFTKYDGKYFAISTAYSKNTKSGYESYNDKLFFAPELKLTKRLSLLDVIQTDMLQVNRKNEIVLRYSPPLKKYADDVQLELGAGQSFYQSDFINSSIRFSTRFKL